MESHRRNTVDFRQTDIPECQLLCGVLFQIFHRKAQHARFHFHNFLKTGNIAHFKIDAGILVQMPRGIVLFGTEHRTNLIDPLEDARQNLLIKLRALRQIGRTTEIIKPENIGAAFRPLRNKLRRMGLDKALSFQIFPERAAQAGLQAEHRPLPLIAQHQRPVIQHFFKGSVNLPVSDRKRQFPGRCGEYPDPLQAQFIACSCPRFLSHHSLCLNAGFLAQKLQRKFGLSLLPHALLCPCGRPEQNERKAAHLPYFTHCSVQADGLAGPAFIVLFSAALRRFHKMKFSHNCLLLDW